MEYNINFYDTFMTKITNKKTPAKMLPGHHKMAIR